MTKFLLKILEYIWRKTWAKWWILNRISNAYFGRGIFLTRVKMASGKWFFRFIVPHHNTILLSETRLFLDLFQDFIRKYFPLQKENIWVRIRWIWKRRLLIVVSPSNIIELFSIILNKKIHCSRWVLQNCEIYVRYHILKSFNPFLKIQVLF